MKSIERSLKFNLKLKKHAITLMLTIAIISLTGINPVSAQDVKNEVSKSERKLGISLKLGGAYDILGGLEADYFIIPKINLELDFIQTGLLDGTVYYGGGICIYPFRKKEFRKWSPYIGLLYGHAQGTTFINGDPTSSNLINMPVGINYIGKRGFNFSFDLSVSHVNETKERSGQSINNKFYNWPIPGIKFGYRL